MIKINTNRILFFSLLVLPIQILPQAEQKLDNSTNNLTKQFNDTDIFELGCIDV
jgi:hypothetical protein